MTRRSFLAGALGLAAASAIARTASAASLTDDPFSGRLADPSGGPRFSLRLQGKEVCSFETLRLHRPDQAADAGTFVGSLDPGALDDLTSDVGDKLDDGDADDDGADAGVVLRDGTAALPALQRWYEANRHTNKPQPKDKQQKPSGREDPALALAQRDAVIVKLSAAGKALGRITLQDASVKTLVLAADGESVEKLVLSFEQLGAQRS